jgi:hypothetical protein
VIGSIFVAPGGHSMNAAVADAWGIRVELDGRAFTRSLRAFGSGAHALRRRRTRHRRQVHGAPCMYWLCMLCAVRCMPCAACRALHAVRCMSGASPPFLFPLAGAGVLGSGYWSHVPLPFTSRARVSLVPLPHGDVAGGFRQPPPSEVADGAHLPTLELMEQMRECVSVGTACPLMIAWDINVQVHPQPLHQNPSRPTPTAAAAAAEDAAAAAAAAEDAEAAAVAGASGLLSQPSLLEALALLRAPAEFSPHALEHTLGTSRVVDVPAGGTGSVFCQSAEGTLLRLRLRLHDEAGAYVRLDGLAHAVARARLRIVADGAEVAQVDASVAEFFGVGPGAVHMRSLLLGVADDATLYCAFAVPYWRTIDVAVRNGGERPARWEVQAEWLPTAVGRVGDTGYFTAHVRAASPTEAGEDFQFASLVGSGHVVAHILRVDAKQRAVIKRTHTREYAR